MVVPKYWHQSQSHQIIFIFNQLFFSTAVSPKLVLHMHVFNLLISNHFSTKPFSKFLCVKWTFPQIFSLSSTCFLVLTKKYHVTCRQEYVLYIWVQNSDIYQKKKKLPAVLCFYQNSPSYDFLLFFSTVRPALAGPVRALKLISKPLSKWNYAINVWIFIIGPSKHLDRIETMPL